MNKFILRLLPLTILALFAGYSVTAQVAPVSEKTLVESFSSLGYKSPPGVESKMKGDSPQKIRKSISVMTNILDYMLKERLGEGYQSRGFFSKGTRGYWIPDSGLVFMLGVKFPLVEPEKVKVTATEKRKSDLWDRFEMKVDSGGRIDPFQSDDEHDARNMYKQVFEIQEKQSRFNEEKVDTMRRTILEALAKYGHRFEGFRNNETITIIIEGEGNSFFPHGVSVSMAPGAYGAHVFTPDSNTVTTYVNSGEPISIPVPEAPEAAPAKVKITQRSSRTPSRITVPQPSSGISHPRGMDEEKISIDRDIIKQESEIQSAHEMLETREDDLAAAQRELEIVKQQIEQKKIMFESGRISQSDLLDAEKKSIEAQRAFNEAQRELIKLKKQLETAQIQYDSLKARKDALSQAKQELKQLSDQQRMQSLIEETIQVNNWSPFSNQTSPAVMVIQIKFQDLPKEEGAAEDIENKVKIVMY